MTTFVESAGTGPERGHPPASPLFSASQAHRGLCLLPELVLNPKGRCKIKTIIRYKIIQTKDRTEKKQNDKILTKDSVMSFAVENKQVTYTGVHMTTVEHYNST